MNPMNVGWSCPLCSRVYAPSVTSCASCNAYKGDPWVIPNVPFPSVPSVPNPVTPFVPHSPTPSIPWVAPPGDRAFPQYFLVSGKDWTIGE